MSKEGCTVRVPDHTDFVDCGTRVLRSNRCAEHLAEEVKDLTAKIKKHQAIIKACKARLDELQTESG
jgi:hypothetical protein